MSMLLDLNMSQATLVAEVDRVIDPILEAEPGQPFSMEIVRECFARLGYARLIAVHYPSEYGGRNLSIADHAAVSERIGLRGLPDVVHLVTVQGVGCAVLAFGTVGQRQRWLPPIAAGTLLASLLLSEEGAGSDLTRITTAATAEGDGWRLHGGKAWSLRTDWSRLALCLARTRRGIHRYDGISLFLVDLAAPGVEINKIDRACGELYHTVTFNDVRIDGDALLGTLHEGWALLPAVIGFERGGFDYMSRAQTWLSLSKKRMCALPLDIQVSLTPGFVQQEFLVESARALAYHAASTGETANVSENMVAYAKLATSQAAQSVARWAGEELLPLVGRWDGGSAHAVLEAAVVEGPEFTISGGARELQLDSIAGDPTIGRPVQ